jgi:hypothetical protein
MPFAVSVSRLEIPAVPKTIAGAECTILMNCESRLDRWKEEGMKWR